MKSPIPVEERRELSDEHVEAAISSIEDWLADGLSEEAFDLKEILSAFRELQSRRSTSGREEGDSSLIDAPHGFYVASRASVPERPAMWRSLRDGGLPVNSTWIDEAGEGETADFSELWQRIGREIARSEGVILYAQPDDFPLKGALIECGIALGMGKPVAIVLRHVSLEGRTLRPLGSWARHPLCFFAEDWAEAIQGIRFITADAAVDSAKVRQSHPSESLREEVREAVKRVLAEEATGTITGDPETIISDAFILARALKGKP